METPGTRRSNTWLFVVIGGVVACLLCACLACALLLGLSVISSSSLATRPAPVPEVATVEPRSPARTPARTPVGTPGLNLTPPAPGGGDRRDGEIQSSGDRSADRAATTAADAGALPGFYPRVAYDVP